MLPVDSHPTSAFLLLVFSLTDLLLELTLSKQQALPFIQKQKLQMCFQGTFLRRWDEVARTCSSFLNSVHIDRIYSIPLITETSPGRSHTNKHILNKSLASIMITISERANAKSRKALDIVPARGDSLMKSVILSH